MRNFKAGEIDNYHKCGYWNLSQLPSLAVGGDNSSIIAKVVIDSYDKEYEMQTPSVSITLIIYPVGVFGIFCISEFAVPVALYVHDWMYVHECSTYFVVILKKYLHQF